MRLKHKLPLCEKIEHLSLTAKELDALKDIVHSNDHNFQNVLEINKKLCGIHHELANSVYDNFYQIGLTDSANNFDSISMSECDAINNDINSKSNSVREKIKISNDTDSPLNEKTYTEKTNFYGQYADTFNTILGKFKSKPTRVRLVRLNAGSVVYPHIDYDPSYSVRIIIPIIADDDCLNIFWDKGVCKTYIFTLGNAYFLNTAYRHAVANLSKTARYTLLISVDGIEDIKHLLT